MREPDSRAAGSVYITSEGRNTSSQAIKAAAESIMGCRSDAKQKVNGVTVIEKYVGVCVGGQNGCGE